MAMGKMTDGIPHVFEISHDLPCLKKDARVAAIHNNK